ncbi:MobP2 family relaxase [Vagococcus teuberi]
MSSPSIILTSEFVTSHDTGAVDYLDRQDRQVDKDKFLDAGIEKEAHDILSLDMIKQLDENDFSTYLNYLGRQQALEKTTTLSDKEQIERNTIEKKLTEFEGKMTTPSTQEKHLEVRGLFDKQSDFLTAEQKDFYKDFFADASKNGAFLFQDVVSFDTQFLVDQGVYDPSTKKLDSTKLKQAGRLMMKKYFELENLEDTGQWVGAIHYNTDHFHIHFSTTESQNTRELISITDKTTGEKKEVRNGFKRQKTINQMKATFVNQLIDRSNELEKLSQLRNQLVVTIREQPHDHLAKDKLNQLRDVLPNEKQRWQYNRLSNDVKEKINDAVQTILKSNKEFDSFKQLVKEESQFRNSLYRNDKQEDYFKNKMADMDVRLGNALLKHLKQVEQEQIEAKRFAPNVVADEKKIDQTIKHQPQSNLSHYSQFNQKKLKEQMPDVSMVGSRHYWHKQGRLITANAEPLDISVPVMKDNGKTLSHFGVGHVYDISQTKEWSIPSQYTKEPVASQPQKINTDTNKLPTNIYRYRKEQRDEILKNHPNARTVFPLEDWVKLGYRPNTFEKPTFITHTYKDSNTGEQKTFERGVFERSQVTRGTQTELNYLKKDLDKAYTTPYRPSAIDYSQRAVNKVARLLEKDYDVERNKFEKERLDRKVAIAQHEAELGY